MIALKNVSFLIFCHGAPFRGCPIRRLVGVSGDAGSSRGETSRKYRGNLIVSQLTSRLVMRTVETFSALTRTAAFIRGWTRKLRRSQIRLLLRMCGWVLALMLVEVLSSLRLECTRKTPKTCLFPGLVTKDSSVGSAVLDILDRGSNTAMTSFWRFSGVRLSLLVFFRRRILGPKHIRGFRSAAVVHLSGVLKKKYE